MFRINFISLGIVITSLLLSADILAQNNNFEKNYRRLNKITFKNGRILRGRLWQIKNNDTIQCETQDGFMLKFPVSELQKI